MPVFCWEATHEEDSALGRLLDGHLSRRRRCHWLRKEGSGPDGRRDSGCSPAAALADRPADDYQQLLAVPTEFDIEYGVDETGNFITERRVAIGEALHSLSGQDSTK